MNPDLIDDEYEPDDDDIREAQKKARESSALLLALFEALTVAAIVAAVQKRGVLWDADLNRFRYDGRLLELRRIRGEVEKAIVNSNGKIGAIVKDFVEGKTDLAQWQAAMKQELKAAHLLIESISKGGRNQMTAADWGKVGARLREQYKYLQNFADGIKSGKIPFSKIDRRAKSYLAKLREIYANQEKENQKDAGMTECRRILHAKESCEECIDVANQGWMPIDEMPEIGTLLCGQYCQCEFEYK